MRNKAEDVLQEVSIAALDKRGHDRGPRPPAALAQQGRAGERRSISSAASPPRPMVFSDDVLDLMERDWAEADRADAAAMQDALRDTASTACPPTPASSSNAATRENLTGPQLAEQMGRSVNTVKVALTPRPPHAARVHAHADGGQVMADHAPFIPHTSDTDDAFITAALSYLAGELDATEVAALEEQLTASAHHRRLFTALATQSRLFHELHRTPAPGTHPHRRCKAAPLGRDLRRRCPDLPQGLRTQIENRKSKIENPLRSGRRPSRRLRRRDLPARIQFFTHQRPPRPPQPGPPVRDADPNFRGRRPANPRRLRHRRRLLCRRRIHPLFRGCGDHAHQRG